MTPVEGEQPVTATANEQLRVQRAVHQAGVLFLVTGVLGFTSFFIPGNEGYNSGLVLLIDGIVVIVGALCRTSLASFSRGNWTLLVGLFGLSIVAVSNVAGLIAPVALGIYFILVFMWIGQWHRPGTVLKLAPIGLLAYMLPFAAGAPHNSGQPAAVILVMSAAVAVGEVLSRQADVVLRAQSAQHDAMAALYRASRIDELTGLGNRRHGNQLLNELNDGDVVVAIDVDHFKRINDTLGHAHGDQLLEELGTHLQHASQVIGPVARMGGEEFLLVARASDIEPIERLLAGWRTKHPTVTLSAGACLYNAGDDPFIVYSRADDALYQAKDAGRDRLMIALSSSHDGTSKVLSPAQREATALPPVRSR